MFYKQTLETSLETIENVIHHDGERIWAISPSDRFWGLYLAWVAEGNTAEEWKTE